ncbi:unnamed protein product [Alopecurus aequalis]
MPPGLLSSSVFRGERAHRPRLMLGTFETAPEAVRANDAAAWRLGHRCSSMNLRDVNSVVQATGLAPPPYIVTREDRRRQLQVECHLIIVEADERAMAEWRCNFPKNVQAEVEFYAQSARAERKKDRAEKRAKKNFINEQLAGPSTIDDDDFDDHWLDMFYTTEEDTA